MDFNRLNKLYKIYSSDLSEKHTKDRMELISDFARRNISNSGPAFKALSEKLKDEIKDHSDVYLNSLSDCIDHDIEISKDEQNQIISRYKSFIQQHTNHKISILKSKLAASNFIGVVSESIFNRFNQIVNRVQQI